MKHAHLTLICHARTDAQRVGRFHLNDDPLLLPVEPVTLPAAPGKALVAPELRTRQTADALGLAGTADPGLRDCDLGSWQGLSLKHLERQDPEGLQRWLADPHAAPHGGESLVQFQQRVAHWLDGLATQGEWLAVTHPMVVRAVLLHVLDAPAQAFGQIDVLPLAQVQLSRYGRWRLRIE